MNTKDKLSINTLVKNRGGHYKIMEGYGMTEIGSATCTNLPQCDVVGSVGVPLPLNILCVFDNDNDCELPYGKSGEICMTGPTVMKGYYKNQTETDNVLKNTMMENSGFTVVILDTWTKMVVCILTVV